MGGSISGRRFRVEIALSFQKRSMGAGTALRLPFDFAFICTLRPPTLAPLPNVKDEPRAHLARGLRQQDP